MSPYPVPREADNQGLGLEAAGDAWIVTDGLTAIGEALGSLHEAVTAMVRSVNVLAIESLPDALRVHSAGVADVRGRLAMIVGTSGVGKTSVTIECLRRGAAYVTDETVAYDLDTRTAIGNRKPLTIKVSGQDRVPDLDPRTHGVEAWMVEGGSWHVPVSWLGAPLVDDPLEPALLVFPKRVEGAATSVTPCHPAAAASRIAEQSSYLATSKTPLKALKRLCESTPAVVIEADSSAAIAERVMTLLAEQ